MKKELQQINAKKRYADDFGEVVVVGLVKNYVVYRRKGAAVNVDAANIFLKKFRELDGNRKG